MLAIANQFKIPVKYIGIGEKMEDLQVFDKEAFVDTLFNLNRLIFNMKYLKCRSFASGFFIWLV